MSCPICQRPAFDFVRNPYLSGDAILLALRINPAWSLKDGAYRHCIECLIDSAAELEKVEHAERPSAIGFREHYRYTLTDSEHGQWHHCNSDMARWRQNQIVERVADAAHDAGRDCWIVLDTDEVMLAQGVTTERA